MPLFSIKSTRRLSTSKTVTDRGNPVANKARLKRSSSPREKNLLSFYVSSLIHKRHPGENIFLSHLNPLVETGGREEVCLLPVYNNSAPRLQERRENCLPPTVRASHPCALPGRIEAGKFFSLREGKLSLPSQNHSSLLSIMVLSRSTKPLYVLLAHLITSRNYKDHFLRVRHICIS